MNAVAYVRLCILAGLVVMSDARCDTGPVPFITIGGLAFGDLYYISSNHLEDGRDAIGAVLRRGYLTFDFGLPDDLSGRLRFEVNQSGEFETYNFKADVKDLYLSGKLGRQRWAAGLTPTLTFDVVEAAWGLRYLARTPLDLQGVPSRDTGVSFKGPINASGSLQYRAMLGTGVTFGSDGNDAEKLMAALNWTPSPGWDIDFYADRQWQQDEEDFTSIQTFIARQSEKYRWGLLYFYQDRKDESALKLASAYMVGAITNNSSWIARVDYLPQPSPKGNDIAYLPFDPTAPATMYMGGIEFELDRHFTLTPNMVLTRYGHTDAGQRPTTDLYLRLTLFINFE